MILRCAWSSLILMLIGCSGGASEDLLPVTGTVTQQDGSPVACESGLVSFQPVGDDGTPASGGVEKDGSFAMMTEKPGDGVKPGRYKVIVQLWKSYRDQTLAVPEKYSDPATTPLEAAVDADHTRFEFKIEK